MVSKKATGPEDPCNVTYQFKGEDHTLGNAERYMLMKNPNVEFVGYTVPHPFKPFMNIRVQSVDGYPADDAVNEALDSIVDVCKHVGKKYKDAVKKFHKENGKATADMDVS